MRNDKGSHHWQNYYICIAQSAMRLHTTVMPGKAFLHTDMRPLRMAYCTISAVVLRSRASRIRALWTSAVRTEIFNTAAFSFA